MYSKEVDTDVCSVLLELVDVLLQAEQSESGTQAMGEHGSTLRPMADAKPNENKTSRLP